MPAILSLILGLALLYAGAEALVRGSSSLALRFGITPLIIGLTIVAFGTSSPELLVSLQSSFEGSPELALGNVIGSNICNIALILGISALIRPIEVNPQLMRLDIPVMIGSSLALCLFLRDHQLVRWEGLLLFVAFLGYIGFNTMKARQNQAIGKGLFKPETPARPSRPFWMLGMFVAGGLVLLAGGARLFVEGAVILAGLMGVSKAVIGLSVVAIGTSLPELATSVVASVKNEGDISAGNIIGSNIFNILCILGLTSTITPLRSETIGLTDLFTMAGIGLLTVPLLRTGFRLNRFEGGLLLVMYAGYMAFLF